ncbi:MAG: tetratricopeptide repeat protein [Gammaproteobacteria bacterium]|nr:tetratricopeptide repeat protein [Gammaproteobacteria bacterium]
MVQGPGQHSSVIRTALIAVFMACALAGQAAWASGETDAALQAYRDGNYPAAIKIWRKLAANDNPDAQYALGVAYLKGHGIARDPRKAMRWFQMAAKSGHRLAQALVAYQAGAFDTAVTLWKRGAERGTTDAQYALGLVLLKGQGVKSNAKQSLQWFKIAAKAGNTAAMFNLGGMYWEGIGTTADATMAVYWWNRAAEKRDPASQFNLGLAYYFGRGVARNAAQATFWIQMAETNGYLGARSALGLMQRGMLIGGLHLRPGDDAVAGGIAALETSRHESIAISGAGMTSQQPVATTKTPDDASPQAKTEQAAADEPEAMRQLQNKLTTANALNVELRKQLDTAATTNHALEQQRKQLNNSLTTVKATNTTLVEENKTLSKKLATATARGTQLRQELMVAKAATQTLEKQYQKLTATVAAANATNAALVNENKALSRRDSTLQQQRAQEEKDEVSLNLQLENLTTAYNALEDTNKAILNEKLVLTTNLKSLTQQLAIQTNEKTELNQKKNELHVRITELQTRLDNDRATLNEQIATLTKTHQALETTNISLIEKKKMLQTRNDDLQSLLEKSKASTAALATQIDRLKERQQEIIASEKTLTAQKVLLEQTLDQQRLSAELLETENISLINRVQLFEKQAAASVAKANESGATKQPLTQPDSQPERSTPSAEAIDNFNNALTLMTQGRPDEAIAVYEGLIKAFPQFPQPYNNLASVFASLGNLERAESLLRQGLELDDRYRLLRKNLGSLLIHRASRIYRQAIDGAKDKNVPAKKEAIALQAFDMMSPLQ